MAYETSGTLTSTTIQSDGKATEITTVASIPTDTSIDVSVKQDESGGDVANNTYTLTITDGTNTNSLTGFSESAGATYWVEFSISTSDDSVTPSFDDITLTTIQTETVSAPVTSLTAADVAASVSPSGSASVNGPVSSTQAVSNLPGFASIVGAPAVDALTTASNAGSASPSGAAPLTAPVDTLTTTSNPGSFGFLDWLLAGNVLQTVTDETSTPGTLQLRIRATTDMLTNTLRPLKQNEGQVSVRETDTGGFIAVDRANGSNSYEVIPPTGRKPLRRDGTHHVQGYEEDLVSADVGEWDVTLELVRGTNRTDSPSISETAGSDEWGFNTRYGTIATQRVSAEFLGTGRDGVERFELSARFTAEQAHAWEAALALTRGSRVKEVPDATNTIRDESEGDANTVTVSSPSTGSEVPDGDYVVLEWESTRLNDAYQSVTATIAAKN